MCFGSGKTSTPTATSVTYEASPPSPYATASQDADVTASSLAEKKRKQLAAMKYGMSSTVKTSGDAGPLNLFMPALSGSLKTKLGA